MRERFTRLTRSQLETTLGAGPPENETRREGYALVNVLDPEQFRDQHIPHSINIPSDRLDEFERRFEKDKKIVVYCASAECPASEEVANALVERGFEQVYDFEGGLDDWRAGRNPVEGRQAGGDGR
jgi:rhodanese-related sulfurtransferase